MKALLFTLLLLSAIISFSIAVHVQDMNRQRIVYSIFTGFTVITFDFRWNYVQRTFVHGLSANTVIQNLGNNRFQVTIQNRRLRQWTFNAGNPQRSSTDISATLIFNMPEWNSPQSRFPLGTLVSDIFEIPPRQIDIRWDTTQTGYERGIPIPYTHAFRTILEPEVLELNIATQRALREAGPNWYLIRRNPRLTAILPMQLSPDIWIHILSGRMSHYQPRDIVCDDTGIPIDMNQDFVLDTSNFPSNQILLDPITERAVTRSGFGILSSVTEGILGGIRVERARTPDNQGRSTSSNPRTIPRGTDCHVASGSGTKDQYGRMRDEDNEP